MDWLILSVSALISFGTFFGYISNNTFPAPLKETEEEACLQKMAAGDGEARNKLIEHNLRLVAHVSKKFESTGIDKDDLISIGTIGLIKAINTFSSDKGVRLATYAARCIENEILMHLRATRHSRHEVYLQEPVGMDKEGNEFPLPRYRKEGGLGWRRISEGQAKGRRRGYESLGWSGAAG